MNGLRPNNFWLCLLVTLLLIMVFPVSGLGSEAGGQKRDIIFVMPGQTFNQVGGDPATMLSGDCLTAQTVFEMLNWVDKDRKATRPWPKRGK